MGSYKFLFKNIGVLTLSSFATKLLSFFLVPLYTNILSTTEYGTYDLFNATIGVLLPIITLNIQDAVLRFSMESKNDREAVISVGTKYFFWGLGIVTAGLAMNYCLGWSSIVKDFAIYFWLMYLSQSLSGIVNAYARGTNHIVDLSVSSVVCSFFVIACNIFFLLVFKWGLVGYMMANIIGPMVQCIYLMVRVNWTIPMQPSKEHAKLEKSMLSYCKPLIANSIAWWINNTSDRYIVIFFCGLAENGIYSVASKIPSILNIFQSIFAQAWTLSVVRDFDSEDKNGFFTNTYKVYNCFMVIMCSLIIFGDKIMAKFLYAKDFYLAWKYVPWLTIAIVFGALSGYIGGFFSAVKNTRIFAQSTILGALVNIFLNFILTPLWGALGAAIATAISFFVIWAFRLFHSRKIIKIKTNFFRDVLTYIVLVMQAIVLLWIESNIVYLIQGIFGVLIIALYFGDISRALTNRRRLSD